MFGLLAALSSLTARDHGRDALYYENYSRTGRDRSEERRVGKEC